jgi:hypothetical protein
MAKQGCSPAVSLYLQGNRPDRLAVRDGVAGHAAVISLFSAVMPLLIHAIIRRKSTGFQWLDRSGAAKRRKTAEDARQERGCLDAIR